MRSDPDVGPAGPRLDDREFDSGGPTLLEVGERRLLDLLVARSRRATGGATDLLIVGSGDDAAVIRTEPNRALVVTQDALVENVDFERRWLRPHAVGRKTLTVSLSDLAGMGARPAFCLLTMCCPPSTRLFDAAAITSGVSDTGDDVSCPLVGGDVSATDGPIVLDLVAAGFVDPDRTLRRDAGRPGDLLVVTGTLGRAAAGLALLQGRLHETSGIRQTWLDAQRRPSARLAEGEALSECGVRCAGDISDGLIVDVRRTATASGCGAELWWRSVPVDPELLHSGRDARSLALGGGEDFELLAAAPPAVTEELRRRWPSHLAPITVVGRLTSDGEVRLLDQQDGDEVELPVSMSEHFHPPAAAADDDRRPSLSRPPR